MAARKKGRLSPAEREFIRAHADTLKAEEIAEKLGRTVEAVYGHLQALGAPAGEDPARGEIRHALHDSVAWRHLREEFDPDEMRYFEERYVALKEQFRDDVMASEEGQLFQAIKAELLMHRNLVQQRRAQDEIDRLEGERARFLKKCGGDPTRMDEGEQARLLNADTLLQVAYAAKQARTAEYEKLGRGHQDIMKSLKATREQRIAKIENSRRSFTDVIRMLQEREAAERADRMADQTRKLAEKELRRLGGVHVYADGAPDRPILNAETAGFDDGGVA